MKKFFLCTVFCSHAFCAFYQAKPEEIPTIKIDGSLAASTVTDLKTSRKIADKVSSSVVQIYGVQKGIVVSPFMGGFQLDPFWDQFLRGFLKDFEKERIHSGSGFLIKIDGIKEMCVVTCAHVVKKSDGLIVKVNDQFVDADLIYTKPEQDIAILKIRSDAKFLTPLTLGNGHNVGMGDTVFVFGYPFGLEQLSMSFGIISATDVRIFSSKKRDSQILIQTDAAMNPGNSGGPLIDYKGNVVGLNTAILSGTGGSHGVGFAVCVEDIKTVIREMLGQKSPSFGLEVNPVYASYLFKTMQKAFKALPNALVVVKASGPFKKGDVIIKIRGKKVNSLPVFYYHERTSVVGEKVPFSIFREGKSIDLILDIGQQNIHASNFVVLDHLLKGYRAEELSKEDALRYGVPEKSIKIVYSPHDGHIAKGDIILNLYGENVIGIKGLQGLLEKHKNNPNVSFSLKKENGRFYQASFMNQRSSVLRDESCECDENL